MSLSEELQGMNWKSKLLGALSILIALALVCGVIFRIAFVYNIDSNEYAYKFDSWNGGKIIPVNHQGYEVINAFTTSLHIIETRPIKICLEGGGRVVNCKLVQFNPAGLDELIRIHGRKDYNESTLKDIFLSYTHNDPPEQKPFFTILPTQVPTQQTINNN